MRCLGFFVVIMVLFVGGYFHAQQSSSHARETESKDEWYKLQKSFYRSVRLTYSYQCWKRLLEETKAKVEQKIATTSDKDLVICKTRFLHYLEWKEQLYELTRRTLLKYIKNSPRLPPLSGASYYLLRCGGDGCRKAPLTVLLAHLHLMLDPAEDPDVRRAVYLAILQEFFGKCCGPERLNKGDKEVRKMLKVFCSDEYPDETAATAAICLWRLREKDEQLVPHIRKGLGTIFDLTAVTILAKDVRDQTTLPRLFDYAASQLPYERQEAARCIGEVASSDDQKALEVLLSLTNDRNYGVRHAAFHGLTLLANRAAVPFVIERLTDKDVPEDPVVTCFMLLSGYVCEKYAIRYMLHMNMEEQRILQARAREWWENNKEKSLLDLLKEAMAQKDKAKENRIYLDNLIYHAERLLHKQMFPEEWWKNPTPLSHWKKYEIILDILEKSGDRLSWDKQQKCYVIKTEEEQR